MDISSVITTILPLIQYPAMLLTCSGYVFLTSTHAKTRKRGFVISATGNVVWIIYGFLTVQPAIIGTISLFSVAGLLVTTTILIKKSRLFKFYHFKSVPQHPFCSFSDPGCNGLSVSCNIYGKCALFRKNTSHFQYQIA